MEETSGANSDKAKVFLLVFGHHFCGVRYNFVRLAQFSGDSCL
jgi:hypothetical protein